jgi:hypothetical protein
MPATSKAQQKFMGIVHGLQKGTIKPSDVSGAAKKVAKTMKKKSAKDFASTKHDDLPNKVKEYLMSENPAASAAAAMVMMKLQNPSTGKKISAVTPLRDKDHPLHKKSKGIFQRLKDKFMKKNESVNEDGHTDVASIERKLKLIIQDSVDTIKKLRSMSNEDSLPSWWTDKITLAKDYVGKSRDYIMNPAESVNEATSLGADMLLGGIATVIKKAGMRPKTAKMMGGGFKVSKRDKVGFKIDVEIRGLDKKKTFPLQFETERGMLYVVIKNKPIKLGKYTMVNQAAQNLKKVGAALIGDKDVKRIA